ncbi:hypothetical protein DIPPA_23335 [Diplonema papillatum]|nr:hypothetical protein DIPPA_23335 [Diplonema papillatum]
MAKEPRCPLSTRSSRRIGDASLEEARRGLAAGWAAQQSSTTRRFFYVNPQTGEATWTKPAAKWAPVSMYKTDYYAKAPLRRGADKTLVADRGHLVVNGTWAGPACGNVFADYGTTTALCFSPPEPCESEKAPRVHNKTRAARPGRLPAPDHIFSSNTTNGDLYRVPVAPQRPSTAAAAQRAKRTFTSSFRIGDAAVGFSGVTTHQAAYPAHAGALRPPSCRPPAVPYRCDAAFAPGTSYQAHYGEEERWRVESYARRPCKADPVSSAVAETRDFMTTKEYMMGRKPRNNRKRSPYVQRRSAWKEDSSVPD